MSLFPPKSDNAYYLSREDEEHCLSAFSHYPFELDGSQWPTVEHYYQAMKFDDASMREKIRVAATPAEAKKLGNGLFKKPKNNWDKIKEIAMTRAVYIKCRTYDDVAQQLLATGDQDIIEKSMYDYYWGCGRDGRGKNRFGHVLQNVRIKLKEETANKT